MHVAHLTLHNFRSYVDVDVALGPGVTAFIGRNGQGKTNLVEAIDYLARLTSHRVSSDAPLVRHGTDQAVVRALVVRERNPQDRRSVTVSLTAEGRRLIENVFPRHRQAVVGEMGALTPEEQEELGRLCRKLT